MTGPLEAVRTRRDELYEAVLALERALTVPAGGRAASWQERARGPVADLRTALENHVEATEGPGGLFEEIMAREPRLAHAIERLRAEHRPFLDAVDETAARIESPGDEAVVEQVRTHLLDVVHRIFVHRHRGAELVYDAYNVDLSAGD
ncbi:MAG: hypothetical protein ACT452_17730 [Microthrixaceae bacterium]